MVTNPKRKAGFIVINLDDRFYKKIDDLQARFPHGAPDLVDCKKLTIVGDVMFEANVRIVGEVVINNDSDEQMLIKSGTVIEG